MTTVTITYLRAHFSEILRDVEQGASYLITRYGRPTALLVPYRGESA